MRSLAVLISQSSRRLALAGVCCVGLLGTACDSTARLFFEPLLFEGVQMLGATPVKPLALSDGSSTWEPACDGDATALRVDFNMLTSFRKPDGDGNVDKDLQTRPGDNVAKRAVEIGKNVTVDTFENELTCIEAHRGDDTAGTCASGTIPTSFKLDDGLMFVDHLQGSGRGTAIGVAILIDQSGSTSGIVDGTLDPVTQRPNCIEGKSGTFDSPSGDTLTKCASDKSNARLAQAKTLLKSLNVSDRAIVFQYNEVQDVKVVCDPLVGVETSEFLEANCFSTDRSFILGDIVDGGTRLSALDGPGTLPGKGDGRSNLWRAVDKVFNYMTDAQRPGLVARHLVIIADGPDTCSPESNSFQHCFKNDEAGLEATAQNGCGIDPATGTAVKFSDVRARIAAYIGTRRTNQLPNDVHISFLHFQSPGYAEHDSRMQQIACMTGGHYLFVNRNAIPDEDRAAAMDLAIQKIRMSLGGHWGLVGTVGRLTEDPGANGVPKGDSYAVAGDLTLIGSPTALSDVNTSTPFGFADASDERLPVLRPCEADTDCGAGAGAACGIRCDPASKLCEKPAQGSACDGDPAIPGEICCAGVCGANVVCVDPADTRSCP